MLGLVLNDHARKANMAGNKEAGEEWGFATDDCLSVTSHLELVKSPGLPGAINPCKCTSMTTSLRRWPGDM